jgi:hypothetical protein
MNGSHDEKIPDEVTSGHSNAVARNPNSYPPSAAMAGSLWASTTAAR